MAWRRPKISWRWIIRGTCLGLLGLCVGVWGLSYFYGVSVNHIAKKGSPLALVCVNPGVVGGGRYTTGIDPLPVGWRVHGFSVVPGRPFSLHVLDGDFLGFTVGVARLNTYVIIPLWFPSVLLAVVSWVAWRKTGRGGMGRGFPVEPLASRRGSAGE